ncbi:MAG TPA: tetratricopeptide repeat protein [Longimicrobiaceae bacterium]|nr:tetratricopeptide repeat protein [Longimicrobiaceae bacterium]
MAAQSAASRSHRKRNASEPDDIILARAIEFSRWARKNVSYVVGGAVLLALLVGGAIYYRMYHQNRIAQAATQYMELEQTAASGNAALAERDLASFIARFDGTVYADEARLLMAQIKLDADQPAEAIAVLEGFPDRIDDSPIGAQGALLLAAAQQAAGETEDAIATYLLVADEAPMLFRRQAALADAALLRMQTQNYAGAVELYTRLVETAEEGSAERSVYEMRRAEAEGLAGG